jgi:hypothetical protein
VANFDSKTTNMATRSILQLHLLASDEFEFFGSPAALYDKHTSEELLISQKSLNNYFSKCGDGPKIYRNAICEIRKGDLYTKAGNRGRKKEA